MQGGNFYDGFRQGIIVAAFNHLQHEGNGTEDVVAEAEASSDGGGDPKGPKQKFYPRLQSRRSIGRCC
ncbi:MAG: hypothetical protein IPN46_06070 [Saprospiraceae bacterium]|nr:hypothetical protein [Saprospiraceae bacterium]